MAAAKQYPEQAILNARHAALRAISDSLHGRDPGPVPLHPDEIGLAIGIAAGTAIAFIRQIHLIVVATQLTDEQADQIQSLAGQLEDQVAARTLKTVDDLIAEALLEGVSPEGLV